MSKREDEKTKLLAGLLNTAAGSCVTLGILGPLIAAFLNLGNAAADVPVWKIVFLVISFLVTAVVLHLLARLVLDELSE